MIPPFHNLKLQKRKFIALAGNNFASADYKKVLTAFKFAEAKHKGQRRDEGTAYLIHPIRVATILLDDVGTWDADVVAAALLHDVVEDCGVRLSTIQRQFGKRVAHFVDMLTRKRTKPRETETEKEIQKREKLSLLTSSPIEVRLIKSADILDNLRCAADIPWWMWTPLARKKFPRWHREFHQAEQFAKDVHPVLYQEIKQALRTFDMKRLVRGVLRFGW